MLPLPVFISPLAPTLGQQYPCQHWAGDHLDIFSVRSVQPFAIRSETSGEVALGWTQGSANQSVEASWSNLAMSVLMPNVHTV